MSPIGGVVLTLLVALIASAHVGTSNAYFEGMAGPYPVRVIVRTPGVIPGLAQISVRVTGDTQPSRITVQPLRWDAGLEGAPPADTARAVAGEVGLYSAELWLMTFGSYSVRVSVEGDAGEGVALVPVNAVAERRLDMGSAMAAVLLGGGFFLLVGAITIFGAAVRESVVEPGAEPSPERRRRAVWAMGIGGVVLALVLWGGWSWWGAVDRAYRAGIFRPLATSSAVTRDGSDHVLTLRIDDPAWLGREWTPLIPDHGKLMHMFLVRADGFDAFAHVHPVSADSNSFAVRLPPLPSGDYRIYADIVHASGFAQTLVDTVAVGQADDRTAAAVEEVDDPPPPSVGALATPSSVTAADPDDSWAAELPVHGSARAEEVVLASGRRVRWASGREHSVDQEVTLDFRVREPDGTPSTLEPYMGMLSHAAVTTVDGSVFVHLHPAGSINMAAKQRFEAEALDGAVAASGPAMDGGAATDGVRFPFVFPVPGSYRIFVQFKVDGVVETGAFDVEVADVEGRPE